ncbi:MAG: ABC transporter ATP-binding protein [Bacillota bacterium]
MDFILRYVKPYTRRILGGTTIKFFGTILDLLIPWILAYLIDTISVQNEQSQVLRWGGLMLLCSVLAWAANVLANRVAARVARDATRAMRHDLFDKITRLSGSGIDRITIPSLISRMTTDSYNIYRAIGMSQRIGIRAPILLLGGILMTLLLDPVLAFILIAMLPFMAVLVIYISKKGIPLYNHLQQMVDRLVRVVRENATGIRIIRALSKSNDEKLRFQDVNDDVAQSEMKASMVMAVNGPIMQFLLNMGLVIVVIAGATRVNLGLSNVGKIIAFLNYFTIILTAMLTITRILTMASKALASSARIAEVIGTQEEETGQTGGEPDMRMPHIAFDHVTFSYNGAENALHDVSFAVGRGESVGILGPTGAGKSTLIRLLLRFNSADEGAVRIYGQDVRDMKLNKLRSRIGVVFQNDTLFRGTIRDNVRLGREISMEEVDAAIRSAQGEAFVREAGGADAQVQTRGQNFSGGQQQRILLARALAGNPEILLLDDSASALDFQTEAALRHELRRLSGSTAIIIALRISAVMHCDKIVVLEDGEVRGIGTHRELLKRCALYREIAELQLGGDGVA